MSDPAVVTLLTDFGDADAYVGAMKGVLLGLAPGVRWIDLTHRIPPQDLHAAAYVLESAVGGVPADVVHLVVVDPGVGTPRRAVAVRTPRGRFVAPDNGVLTPVLEEGVEEAVSLPWPPDASATFHGRDVFAPAAARLARGDAMAALGDPVEGDLVRLPEYRARRISGGVAGRVLHVDRFGNAISSIRRDELPEGTLEVEAAGRAVGPLRRTYGDVAVGEALALVGSAGHVEVAVRNGGAAAALGLRSGDGVVVRVREG